MEQIVKPWKTSTRNLIHILPKLDFYGNTKIFIDPEKSTNSKDVQMRLGSWRTISLHL